MNAKTTLQDFAAMRRVFPTWNMPMSSLPIHFTLGDREYHGMPENTRVQHELTDTNISRSTYIGVVDGYLEIQLIHTEYRDYPVREWVASFTNIGTEDTPILENAVLGGLLDGRGAFFRHSNGDVQYDWFTEDFTSEADDSALREGVSVVPTMGTSSHGGYPFMHLQMEDYSLRIGIGWLATWNATVKKTEDGGAVYTVGQKRCHMVIHPGETMRTPMLTVLAHSGSEDHGRNLWRRWYFAHILPRENGEPLKPFVCRHNFSAGGHPEFTGATEENQLEAMNDYHNGGLDSDIWWVDAGWYACDYNWMHTGTWEHDAERFPNGLAPLSKRCHELGMRFLLWFEPERIVPDTWIHENHHEWLLPQDIKEDGTHCNDHLLDLSQKEAAQWLTEHTDRLIKKYGVDIYRQDTNFYIDRSWLATDEPDRIGARENLHVQNFLRFWDELLLRNPGLWIDSCGRYDLDVMRRSVTLHYTDAGYGNHPMKQKQHRAMFEWIPYFRAHNQNWDEPDGTYGTKRKPVDEFAFQNAMTPALTAMTKYTDTERFALDRKMQPIWREAAELTLSGDYYPLTECRMDAHDWYAMQFDDSDTGTGFVQVIRNILVEEDSYTVRMHTEPGKTYTFTDRLTGNSFTKTADALAGGLTVTLPHRSGVVLFYTYH